MPDHPNPKAYNQTQKDRAAAAGKAAGGPPATPRPPYGDSYRPPGTYGSGTPAGGVRPSPTDPTNPGASSFNPLPYDPSRPGDPFGVGQFSNNPDVAVDQFNYLSKQASSELSKGNYDQKAFEDYYSQAQAPIESDFYKQAGSTASYLARQGLGSTGINVASSADLTANKSALEGQAKLKSLDLAREAHRREVLDAFSTSAMGMQPVLQSKGIDVGLQIARMNYQAMLEQLNAQESAGWGQLLGGLGGAAILGLALSDERAKEEISDGPPGGWKTFRYKPEFGNPGIHTGVIAQEIEEEHPDCVVTRPSDGMKLVDYKRLALKRGGAK